MATNKETPNVDTDLESSHHSFNLLHNGFVLDMTPPHTARYAKYRQVKGNVWYYIGKAGAVRISRPRAP